MISSSLNTFVKVLAGAGPFAFPFKTFDAQDVEVKVRLIADGSETILTQSGPIQYTISGIGATGGSIALTPSAGAWTNGSGDLVAGYEMYIRFVPNLQQLIRFRDLGPSAPTNIENAVDRLTMFIKGFFEGLGDVARSIKLPTSIHPDEFSVDLPSDLNASEDYVIGINETLDGFRMVDIFSAGAPGAVQTIGAGGAIAITASRRQHLRIESDGGQKQLNVQPFGTNDALLLDGMEIIVEGTDDANFNRLVENDADYGFIGNGGIDIKRANVVTFIYNATIKRFKLKSNGAW